MFVCCLQASFAAGNGRQLPASMAPPPPPAGFQSAPFQSGHSGLTPAQLQQLQQQVGGGGPMSQAWAPTSRFGGGQG